jgi:hypothetical protein
VLLYGDTAVVTGRTEMMMLFWQDSATVRSRYTHVYVRQGGYRGGLSSQPPQTVI